MPPGLTAEDYFARRQLFRAAFFARWRQGARRSAPQCLRLALRQAISLAGRPRRIILPRCRRRLDGHTPVPRWPRRQERAMLISAIMTLAATSPPLSRIIGFHSFTAAAAKAQVGDGQHFRDYIAIGRCAIDFRHFAITRASASVLWAATLHYA